MSMWKRFAVSVLAALSVITLLLSRVDAEQLVAVLRQAQWPLLLSSLATGYCTIFLKAHRWSTAIAAGGTERPRRKLFAASVIGTAGNGLLPARLGDVLRALVLRKHNGTQPGQALLAGWGVLALDLLVLTVLLLVGVAFGKRLASVQVLWLVLAGVTTGITLVSFLARHPRTVAGLANALPGALGSRAASQIEQALNGLAFLHRPRAFALIVAYTTAIWAVELATMWLALAAFRIEPGLAACGLLVAALGLSFTLPMTPGNVGTYQLVVVLVLGHFSVGYDSALAFGIGYHAFALLAVLVGGLWFFHQEGLSLRQLNDVSTPQT